MSPRSLCSWLNNIERLKGPKRNDVQLKTRRQFEPKEPMNWTFTADGFRHRFCGAFQDSRRHSEADHSRPDRRRRGLHGPGLRTVPRRPSDSGDAGQRRRRQRPRGLDPRPNRRCPWSANAPSLLFFRCLISLKVDCVFFQIRWARSVVRQTSSACWSAFTAVRTSL